MKKGNAFGGIKFLLALAAGMTWLVATASPRLPSNQGRVEVIVEPESLGQPDLAEVGAQVKKRFPALGLMLVEVPARRLGELERLPGVRHVTVDREVSADAALPLERAVKPEKPSSDLVTAVLAGRNGETAPCRPAGRVVVAGGRLTQADPAGGGKQEEACLEVIPGAPTWELQALNADGRGRLSDLLTALEWVAESVQRHRIRVLAVPFRDALSLPEDNDPLVTATARLWARGVAVVVPERTFGGQTGSRLTSMR